MSQYEKLKKRELWDEPERDGIARYEKTLRTEQRTCKISRRKDYGNSSRTKKLINSI
jgi:hypothetical protein